MQATPDIFLGWTRGPGGRDFYFRQLWDMKGSVDLSTIDPGVSATTAVCVRGSWPAPTPGAATPSRSRPTSAKDTFDGAIADLAETYADLNVRDHWAYAEAVREGRLTAVDG